MSTDVVLPVTERGPEAGTTVLAVNGQAHALRIEPRVSLLDALREHLGLNGSKKGCDQGTRSPGPAHRKEPRPSRAWSTTPTTYGFTHHVLYNIPATATELTPPNQRNGRIQHRWRRHLPRSGSPTGTRAPLLLLRALPPRRRPRGCPPGWILLGSDDLRRVGAKLDALRAESEAGRELAFSTGTRGDGDTVRHHRGAHHGRRL